MIDLGGLGGTIGFPVWLNDWGQVVGFSDVAGDASNHGFLWSRGKMTDLLPASGGEGSWALWINNLGDVIGGSTLPGEETYHASLWRSGACIELGTVGEDSCSEAWSINDFRQIVGMSNACGDAPRAFLWQTGGPMVDLNALVENPSELYLYAASYIDDRGEIIAQGMLSNGDIHTVLLVPDGPCKRQCRERIAESQKSAPRMLPGQLPDLGKGNWVRKQLSRYRAIH